MVLGYKFDEPNRPLNPTEREQLLNSIHDCSCIERTCIYLGLYGGLNSPAMAHLNERFILDTEKGLKIRLPREKAECVSLRYRNITPRNEHECTCRRCDGSSYKFLSPRTIPVLDEGAVSAISNWFELHNTMPSQQTINRRIDSVGEKSGITRLTSESLRHSFGVILAGRGFERKEIATVMGFSDIEEYGTHGGELTLCYGRLCKGSNPFLCGAEKVDGGICKQPVINGRCQHHSGEQCNAETTFGRPCQRTPKYPDGRCSFHTDCD